MRLSVLFNRNHTVPAFCFPSMVLVSFSAHHFQCITHNLWEINEHGVEQCSIVLLFGSPVLPIYLEDRSAFLRKCARMRVSTCPL